MSILNGLFAKLGFKVVAVESTQKKTDRQIVEDRNDFHKILTKSEDLNKTVQEIQGQIILRGYKDIPAILNECSEHSIEQFVRLQLVTLGAYNPEQNNLESLTKSQLIKFAVHNNREQFRQRCIESGQIKPATESQLDLIEKIATENNFKVDFSQIKDSFEASDMIEMLQDKFNVKPEDDNSATESQIESIKSLCKRLNLEVACEMYTDRQTASQAITNLIKMAPPVEPHKATDSQVEYAMRLWKNCGHKKTAKKEESFRAMTTTELSKVINELKKEYAEKYPDANNPSEGQITYIKQLFEICMLPVPSEMPKTKKGATDLINKMNKKYLFILSRATNPSLTEQDINKMSVSTVKELIAQIKMENITKNYNYNPVVGEDVQERP